MSLHLCLFTDSQEPSGVGEHLLTLSAELTTGYRISLVSPPTPGGRRLLDAAGRLGIETLALSACYHEREALGSLADWLIDTGVDIFHCHAGVAWEGFGGVEAADSAGVQSIIRTEHLPYLLTHPVQREDHARTVRLADKLISVSAEAAASYLKAGVPREKLQCIRNGIRPNQVPADGAGIRASLGLPEGASIVLTVGRFTEQKGHTDLIDAIPRVLQRLPETYFVWVGEGNLEGQLRVRVRSSGLDAHVCFLGRRDDVPSLMAAADLFALPSRFEGLPLVALEAQAAGLPVVGTQVCGTSEAVADGITGRLVPPGDPFALAEAMLEVLEKPELAACWGSAGRRRVEREFTAARMARETAAIYESAYQQGDLVVDSNRFYRRRGHSY